MSRREMKEELTCPICMELFRQPRRLPCGHSYCHVCIKTMLDRRTEQNGSFLNYSRPLVCPECREEVSVDFVRGIEGIPLDFKLSKLVDLFQFMKKNDDSDSSDNELPFKSVPCIVTADPPLTDTAGAAAASVSLPVTSVPTTPVAESSESPLRQANHPSSATSDASQVHPSQSSPAANLSTGAVDVDTGSPVLLTESHSPHRSSSNTSGSSGADLASHSASNSGTISSNQSDHLVPQSSSRTTNASQANQVDTGITFSNLLSQGGTQVGVRSSNTLLTRNTQSSSLESPDNRSTTSDAVSVANTDVQLRKADSSFSQNRTVSSDSHLGAVGGVALSSQFHSSEERLSASGSTRDLRNSSPYPVPAGGISDNTVSTVTQERDSRSLSTERVGQLDVDDVISLPTLVSGNRSTAHRSRNLSQSSVSLPADVNGEINNQRGNVPELNSPSREPDRFSRAQSVPTETGKQETSARNDGASAALSSVKSQQKVKKEKRRRRRTFLDSDSSSDSSSENERREVKRSTGKKKQWLMTRFLKSVIFSDSSSTDYSDDDDNDDRRKETDTARSGTRQDEHSERRDVSSRHQSQTEPRGSAQSSIDPATIPKAAATSTAAEAPDNSRRRSDPAGHQPQGNLRSIDTVPKELSRQRSTAHSSIDSTTTPKEIDRSGASGINSGVRPSAAAVAAATATGAAAKSSKCASSNSVRQSVNAKSDDHQILRSQHTLDSTGRRKNKVSNQPAENISPNSASAGPLATFYDNINSQDHSPISSGERTRYDNVVPETALYGNSGRAQRGVTVRNPGFNPSSLPESANFERSQGRTLYDNIDDSEGRTLYDNIDDSELVFEGDVPLSPGARGRYAFTARNPVTDIEDLKTGYEHLHPQNTSTDNSITDSYRIQSGISDNRGEDANSEHMGELNHDTRVTSQGSSQSGDRSGRHGLTLSWPDYTSGPNVEPRCSSGDHPSSYDNLRDSGTNDISRGSETGSADRSLGNEGREMAQDSNRPTAGGLSLGQRQFVNTSSNSGGHQAQYHDSEHSSEQTGREVAGLELVENYFEEENLEQFHRGSASLQNLAPAGAAMAGDGMNHMGARGDRTTESATASSSSPSSSSATATTVGGSQAVAESSHRTHPNDNNNTKAVSSSSGNDDDADEEEEDESHSGTSMLQNRKKPRSRLKKFLTSLLSLSSSSDDDEENYDNRTSSSKSSDW